MGGYGANMMEARDRSLGTQESIAGLIRFARSRHLIGQALQRSNHVEGKQANSHHLLMRLVQFAAVDFH